MRLGRLALVVAAGTLAPTAIAAPPARLAEMPGVEALPRVPPLAPPQPPLTEVPRLRGTVSARNRVVVGMAVDGTPTSVEVVQRLQIRSLGDYSFFIPAPALSAVAALGSESQPGLRPNQLVWQGFSPRRKVLAARVALRLGGTVSALPLRIHVTGAPSRPGPFELTITVENATRTRAQGFTAAASAAEVVRAVAALRAAAGIDRAIEGRVVRIRGRSSPATFTVLAPFGFRGSVSFSPRTVRAVRPTAFTRLLGGQAERVTVRGVALRAAAPRLRIVATPDVRAALPAPSSRTLEAAVSGYLRYARTRQYESFLANPDLRGPSFSTYVYETRAAERSPAPQGREPTDDGSALPVAILVGGLTLLGLGFVVLWAHL